MGRYTVGLTTTGAGTSLRPVVGLLSTAAVTGLIRQIKVTNTTATACLWRVVEVTGGTAGGDLTEYKYRRNGPTPVCLGKGLWTADATIVDTGHRIHCAASIGSGGIATFGDTGLETLLGATTGIGLVPDGTGQIVVVELTVDE